MKGIAFAVLALALAGAAAKAGAAQAPDAKQVHAQGCVATGTEIRCLVVKDAATGKLYNVIFKGPRPTVGMGIEFTGVPFQGVTTCMQGAPVQVTDWTRKDSLKCQKRGNVD